MKRHLSVLGLLLILVLSACGQNGIRDAKNWPIDDFSFTNQEGEEFGLKDLKGQVWVADFIFTNCTTVCPPMTFNKEKLQTMVKEEGIEDVQFVSFSVDPEIDSPEALKKYGEQFNVDFNSFHLLTGYSQEFIEEFARKSFKAIVDKPQTGDQVVHQTYYYLVDQNGKIMKYYSGSSDVPYAEIIEDIKALQ